MDLVNVVELAHPRGLVFRTYRDRLLEMLPYLPDVERIQIVKREEDPPHRVRLENHWQARPRIPRAAQGVVRPEWLQWIDYAVWDERDWSCTWRFELPFLREVVAVSGKNLYQEPTSGHTRLEFWVDMRIEVGKIPGVPRMLAGVLQPQVERFLLAAVRPNLISVTRGLEELLRREAESGGGP